MLVQLNVSALSRIRIESFSEESIKSDLTRLNFDPSNTVGLESNTTFPGSAIELAKQVYCITDLEDASILRTTILERSIIAGILGPISFFQVSLS